jgi:hypothetical protein
VDRCRGCREGRAYEPARQERAVHRDRAAFAVRNPQEAPTGRGGQHVSARLGEGQAGAGVAWVGSVDPASATSAATYSVARSKTSGGTYKTVVTGLERPAVRADDVRQ